MKFSELLPIGTVVLLKDAQKKLMIFTPVSPIVSANFLPKVVLLSSVKLSYPVVISVNAYPAHFAPTAILSPTLSAFDHFSLSTCFCRFSMKVPPAFLSTLRPSNVFRSKELVVAFPAAPADFTFFFKIPPQSFVVFVLLLWQGQRKEEYGAGKG